MGVKAVLFDFGGTLDSNGLTWLNRFFPLYERRGIAVSKDAFARAFYDSDDRLPTRFALKNMDLQETLRLQVRCVLEQLLPNRIEEADAIADAFLEESRRSLREAEPLLRRLRRRYRLGIVSNFYGNMEAVLAGEGLDELFDAVADSGDVGSVKPDARIFMAALDALRVKPESAWMVGDNLERDMRGAEALGMRHAWLRGPRPAADACCPRAAVLSSLAELESLLPAEAVGAPS
ncbi:MAG: HAD family hydrolase [Elusimicrobia bacterium]|nr:HAD family hydrolase [Elusimicrobiota bacterium]